MNIKERIMEMNKIFAEDSGSEPAKSIDELLLTFVVKFPMFEPCKYVSEDEEWVTFIIQIPDESIGNQIMTLKKSEIVSFGICNEKNLVVMDHTPKIEPESLYQ